MSAAMKVVGEKIKKNSPQIDWKFSLETKFSQDAEMNVYL